MKQVVALVLPVFCLSILPAIGGSERFLTERNVRQCVVVTTDSWSASKGKMSLLERNNTFSQWRPHRSKIPVVTGKSGMAWGRGLAIEFGRNRKKEGDNKAPAGVFVLRGVFGYAPKADTKMKYLALSQTIVGVDDPQSRYYNQLVDTAKIKHPDWRTAEQMRRKDNLYKWGVIVDHNGQFGKPPQPGAGSCIFLHIWRGPDQPTVGCTAMAEKDIVDLIHWLNPTKNPVLVQLPKPAYDEMRAEWNLP